MTALPEREKRVLAFERQGGRARGQRTGDPRQLAMSSTRYYQLLNELIDRPNEAADPVLVKRLRRQRSRRERIRSPRAERGEGGAA